MIFDEEEDFGIDDEELDPSNIREVYKQTTNNARAYMRLRFGHFATYTVITTFLGTSAYQNRSSELTLYGLACLGILVTLLFWILDNRTGQFLRYYLGQSRIFEDELVPSPAVRKKLLPPIPRPRFIDASSITNVIFGLILSAWLFLLGATFALGPLEAKNGAQLKKSNPVGQAMQPADFAE
jgi:hypothetical protein